MRSRMLGFLFVLLIWPGVMAAQDSGGKTGAVEQPPLANAKEQDEIQRKIAAMEARIKMLEQEKQQAEQQTELEKLRQEAAQAAAEEARPATVSASKVFTSGERQQQSLNPNISVTGDFLGYFSDLEVEEHEHAADEHGHGVIGGKQFMLREAEFHLVSNLDPYTRAKFFLGVPGGGTLHIGEAYMEFVNLPANLGLKIGKYRTQFGVLNRWHAHGLPQVDRPLVLTQFLGEGLSGFGIAGNVLLPRLWSHVNELDVEVIYGGDGISFTNAGSKPWVAVGHLKNYYDLTTNTYLELGFSGAYGHNDLEAELRTILAAVDLTYKWVPAGRSKYRTFEFRNELIFSRREGLLQDVNSMGFYSYVENKLNARWWAGLRFDYTQLPESNDEHAWGLSPHLTFWQSEFVFMRLQFSHVKRHDGDRENALLLQSVWSMGPHKHEAY
ncbi:MAG: hypothetical protein DKINENOH_03031 [bacterium]|nr:hypothetical protein [bacterium]